MRPEDYGPNVNAPGLHENGPIRESVRSLANLLVCTSTELPFTQLPSYTAKVDRFVHLIQEWIDRNKAAEKS